MSAALIESEYAKKYKTILKETKLQSKYFISSCPKLHFFIFGSTTSRDRWDAIFNIFSKDCDKKRFKSPPTKGRYNVDNKIIYK